MTEAVIALAESSGWSHLEALRSIESCGELSRLVARVRARAKTNSLDRAVNSEDLTHELTHYTPEGGSRFGAGALFATIKPVMTEKFFDQLQTMIRCSTEQLDAILDECETTFRMRGERRGIIGLRKWVVAYVMNRGSKVRAESTGKDYANIHEERASVKASRASEAASVRATMMGITARKVRR